MTRPLCKSFTTAWAFGERSAWYHIDRSGRKRRRKPLFSDNEQSTGDGKVVRDVKVREKKKALMAGYYDRNIECAEKSAVAEPIVPLSWCS